VMEPDMSKRSLGAWCSRLAVGSAMMPLQQEDSFVGTARGFVVMPICSAPLALQVGMTRRRRVQLMKARLHSTASSATLQRARCVAAPLAPGRGLHCMKGRAWVTACCGQVQPGHGRVTVQEPRNKQARSSGIQEATTSTTVAGPSPPALQLLCWCACLLCCCACPDCSACYQVCRCWRACVSGARHSWPTAADHPWPPGARRQVSCVRLHPARLLVGVVVSF
jgi:hypothetical protein